MFIHIVVWYPLINLFLPLRYPHDTMPAPSKKSKSSVRSSGKSSDKSSHFQRPLVCSGLSHTTFSFFLSQESASTTSNSTCILYQIIFNPTIIFLSKLYFRIFPSKCTLFCENRLLCVLFLHLWEVYPLSSILRLYLSSSLHFYTHFSSFSRIVKSHHPKCRILWSSTSQWPLPYEGSSVWWVTITYSPSF